MRREIDVMAHRMVTEYDKNDSLLSTLEFRVPADQLDFFQEVLEAEENDKEVRCKLAVRSKSDGDVRALSLSLKNSKMQKFVPVAVFTKYGDSRDNLTELFSTGHYGRYELTLLLEVVDERQQEGLDFDTPPEVTPAWVQEQLRLDEHLAGQMIAEGCPNCPDANTPIDPEFQRVSDLIASSSYDDVCNLLTAVGIDHTDWDDPLTSEAEDLISMKQTLLLHWEMVATLEFKEWVA